VVWLNKSKEVAGSIGCYSSSLSTAELLADECVLSVLEFGRACRATGCARHFSTGLMTLEENSPKEVWYSATPVDYGIERDLYWSANEDMMFVGTWVCEGDYANLRQAISSAYAELIHFIRQRSYQHIVRMWNYFADINLGEEDNERYKQFCLGRHDAFEQCDYLSYPAATAIGHAGGDVLIYLLAAKNTPLFFENPQQLSAYCYPREYGPRSPSFARAACLKGESALLYLSGTASIKGHQSHYEGDFERQWALTWDNILALLASISNDGDTNSQMMMLKIYLRAPRYLSQAVRLMSHRLQGQVDVLYLQGDVCREELLLEIDGVGVWL